MATMCIIAVVLVAATFVAFVAANLSPAGMVGEAEYETVEGPSLSDVWSEMDSVDVDLSGVETPERFVAARAELRLRIAVRVLSSRGRSPKSDPWFVEDLARFTAGGTL